MSADNKQTFWTYTDDADFRTKFAIAVVCAIGSALIVPGILFLGYLTETMKRATIGRKGLPEWKNFGEMCMLGGVALLSLLYLLPAALLTALSVLPVLGGANSFFSVSAFISRFIYVGAIVAFVVGLAFTVCALHVYLKTGKILDIFQIGPLYQKIMENKSELGSLIGLAAAGVVVISFANWWLGWFGSILSFLGFTFISLMVASNSGIILGPTVAGATPALEEANGPAAALPSDNDDFPFDDDDDDDAWIPT